MIYYDIICTYCPSQEIKHLPPFIKHGNGQSTTVDAHWFSPYRSFKHPFGGFPKWWYLKIDGLYWKIPWTWMIWGYPYFRKPSFLSKGFFTTNVAMLDDSRVKKCHPRFPQVTGCTAGAQHARIKVAGGTANPALLLWHPVDVDRNQTWLATSTISIFTYIHYEHLWTMNRGFKLGKASNLHL